MNQSGGFGIIAETSQVSRFSRMEKPRIKGHKPVEFHLDVPDEFPFIDVISIAAIEELFGFGWGIARLQSSRSFMSPDRSSTAATVMMIQVMNRDHLRKIYIRMNIPGGIRF
jgi:hypothetical protein